MKEEPEKETNLVMKAQELDEYYKEITGTEPKTDKEVIELIEEDYRLFDPSYPPKKRILFDIVNKKGMKTRVSRLNPDYVKWFLTSEDCQPLTIPVRTTDRFKYTYHDKVFERTFNLLMRGNHKHFDDEDRKRIKKNRHAFDYKCPPAWHYMYWNKIDEANKKKNEAQQPKQQPQSKPMKLERCHSLTRLK